MADTEPTCGKCQGIMTPYNATIHPELFLHDRCLPNELRPPDRRLSCIFCKIDGLNRAEAFLHEKLHSGDKRWSEWGEQKLNKLPYILFPIVAELMEEYRRAVLPEVGVCEHGVADGDFCEPCNKEYKRARLADGDEL
jgi:hypothetical protein